MATDRNVLLEGPVGVGKTRLALEVCQSLGRPIVRIDGDGRYTEQKLTGWFDPPTVLKRGYSPDAFVPGPLVEAMEQGAVLFINELNRLPEGVQNVLLPAIDERKLQVPRLGLVSAQPGFLVLATQNPKEFVATSHLSEALLDRFELVAIEYQSFDEEIEIVRAQAQGLPGAAGTDVALGLKIAQFAVGITQATRSDPVVRRGASVRAAIAIAELTAALLRESNGADFGAALETGALLALPTRIEIERTTDVPGAEPQTQQQAIEAYVRDLVRELLRDGYASKKKP